MKIPELRPTAAVTRILAEFIPVACIHHPVSFNVTAGLIGICKDDVTVIAPLLLHREFPEGCQKLTPNAVARNPIVIKNDMVLWLYAPNTCDRIYPSTFIFKRRDKLNE